MNPALTFVLMCLGSYRLTRIVTADTLTDWFREGLKVRAEEGSFWWEKALQLFECPFCWGFYVSTAVVAWCDLLIGLQYPVLQWWAVSMSVGILGHHYE